MKVSLHLSLAFSLLTCMSTESFAKFSFRSWRGVEQYSKEDSHPVLGKIHSNLLSNLRLLDGTLYTFSKEHSQDKPKGDLIDFGQFLKTMFPSNAGVFAPSSEERSPIYHLSPYDIGCVVRLTKERKDINEIFEKNGKFYKRFHEAYYGRLMNDMKKNNNKNTQLLKRDFSPPSQEDIKKEIKDLENKISNKEEVRAQMMSMGNDVSAISQEIRKLKEKFSSIELSEKITNEHKEKFAEQHNQLIAMIKKNAKLAVEKSSQEFSEQVKKAIQCLQNQDHYPKNLVEMTFLALFWEKFSTKQDMQDFLSGLNGKDIKWEPQDIETENEILKILDSQDLQSLENKNNLGNCRKGSPLIAVRCQHCCCQQRSGQHHHPTQESSHRSRRRRK